MYKLELVLKTTGEVLELSYDSEEEAVVAQMMYLAYPSVYHSVILKEVL